MIVESYITCAQLNLKILTRRCMLINLLISTGMSTAKMKEKFSKSLRGDKSKPTSFFRVLKNEHQFLTTNWDQVQKSMRPSAERGSFTKVNPVTQMLYRGKKGALPILLCVKSRVRTDLSRSKTSFGNACCREIEYPQVHLIKFSHIGICQSKMMFSFYLCIHKP